MKTYKKTQLPEEVDYNGQTYHPDNNLTIKYRMEGMTTKQLEKAMKKEGKKAVIVSVLAGKDVGKEKPTEWVFTNQQKAI